MTGSRKDPPFSGIFPASDSRGVIFRGLMGSFRKGRNRNTCCKMMKVDMGVSKNRGTPKWMVYNGKPYQNG